MCHVHFSNLHEFACHFHGMEQRMEIVPIFVLLWRNIFIIFITLQRKKLVSIITLNISNLTISSNFRNFCSHRYNPRETCPCIRESRGGEERCTDYERIDEPSRTTIFGCIQGENSCLIRQRRTYAPFALDRGANGFEGRNLADRDINPEWTQRDAGGNYARYIFPPSRVIGIPEAHASHDPLAPRWQPLFRDGDDPFCDDESRRRLCRWAGVWRRDNETRSI